MVPSQKAIKALQSFEKEVPELYLLPRWAQP